MLDTGSTVFSSEVEGCGAASKVKGAASKVKEAASKVKELFADYAVHR